MVTLRIKYGLGYIIISITMSILLKEYLLYIDVDLNSNVQNKIN